MEDILPRLSLAKVFMVVDVESGYCHAALDETSSHMTTFATPLGRFRCKRLPFGLSVAPDIFQRKLDETINGLTDVARIVDDIIIWGGGATIDEALANHDHHVK